jgi:hypothetical protein
MKRKKGFPEWDSNRRVTWRLDPRNHEFLVSQAEEMGLRSLNAVLNVVLSRLRAETRKPARRPRKRH